MSRRNISLKPNLRLTPIDTLPPLPTCQRRGNLALQSTRESFMRPLILAAFPIFLAGCVTDLTAEAQRVRQLSLATAERCTFLGPVAGSEYFAWTTGGDAQSALNKVRNEVAKRGGNAFVLTQTVSNDDGTISHADAYRCP
jgi:hypothetical protein